jgi:class 3 adenylate cyclase
VAGYSRLMGEDEEGTHERLKAHLRELVEPKIADHRGRTVKNIGDGFLAEFPSVVDAPFPAHTAGLNRTYLPKLEKAASYPGLDIMARLATVLEVKLRGYGLGPPPLGQRSAVDKMSEENCRDV